jgi:DNA-binding transcriptional LysR family regulator
MELRQLVTFRTVAQTLSFSRAASALNYVQSNVTMQIQALEEELGIRLFDRLGKRVALTDAGRRFLLYADRVLDLLDEARSAVNEGEELVGTVTISAPESLCAYRLPEVLRQFRQRFPKTRVIFRPYPFLDLKHRLCEGSVDVIFLMDEPICSTGLIVDQLVEEPLRLLVAPDHPLAERSVVHTEDLQGEFFLLSEKGCTYRTLLERSLSRAGINETTDLEFNSTEAIKQCTIAGMGIAFLPEVTVKDELERGQLVALSWEDHDFQVVTQMLWHKEKWLSPVLKAFLQVAREVITPAPVPLQSIG